MSRRRLLASFILGGLPWGLGASIAAAQVFSTPSSSGKLGGSMTSLDAVQTTRIDSNIFLMNAQNGTNSSPLQIPSGSISAHDLRSPAKARSEYEKGYRFLMRKDLQAAIQGLSKSIAIYPEFVAAHNALGTAYLSLGESQQAREAFAKAVALDDHLPNSYLNLGTRQVAADNHNLAQGRVAVSGNSANPKPRSRGRDSQPARRLSNHRDSSKKLAVVIRGRCPLQARSKGRREL
jgi:hypothetical protein